MKDMKAIIEDIANALKKSDNFKEALLNSERLWKEDYPIAIIHSKSRMSETLLELFKDLFDENSHTPTRYTSQEMNRLQANASEAFQSVKLLALNAKPTHDISYQAKRKNDFWKKIQNVEHIDSSFDYIQYDKNINPCKVEFDLREIVRKRKEVHAFKGVGFIWMAETQKDVSEVFKHYFKENYLCIDARYHIGYSDTLNAINMRSFVCPPN